MTAVLGGGDKRERIERYAAVYRDDYDFESVMVAARQRQALAVLEAMQPRVVVEAGCGMDLLSEQAESRNIPFERWVVVEPSSRFAAVAAAHATRSQRVSVVEAFLEDAVEAVRECAGPADVVVCSSLLHEVSDPADFLGAARALLGSEGRIYVDVPNAQSLHRRLARAMGLISEESDLSPRNLKLGQDRVYGRESLRAEVAAAGFRVVEEGGYFLKPFTNAQMAGLAFVEERVVGGLWEMGRELPELAAEIYCVAERQV